MKYQHAHEQLFDRNRVNNVHGAIDALRRPVPTQLEYSNEAAREYADIAVRNLRNAPMRNAWPSFIVQGLRLQVLERIFKARILPIPQEMRELLQEINGNEELRQTRIRAGL